MCGTSCRIMATQRKNNSSVGPRNILRDSIYLTNEAASIARVKPSTIRRAVRLGKIIAKGRPFRILGSELLKFAGGAA